jgi:hypothetical protein
MTTTSDTLYIVAHEDDSLLFQSPSLLQSIQAIDANSYVRTIHVTAGDIGMGESYWGGREEGMQAAYAAMANVANNWTESTLTVGTHSIVMYTLNALPNITLVFMRLPDGGWPAGTGTAMYGYQSLMQLWLGTKSTITAVDNSTTYTLQDLINTVAAMMISFQPQRIAVQDFVGTFGDGDHMDHYAAADIAQAAHLSYTFPHTLVGYGGYGTYSLPVNVSGTQLTDKSNAFYTYAAYDSDVCSSAVKRGDSDYAEWLARQYTVGTETGGTAIANDVALLATATASSQNTSTGQLASSAIDGVISGYPDDDSAEWATVGGGVGSWLLLTWNTAYTIDYVVLFNRINANDQITSGTLTFSDGTVVSFGALPDTGGTGEAGLMVTPSSPITTTTLLMTVTGVSATTHNIGLAEIQAWGSVVVS